MLLKTSAACQIHFQSRLSKTSLFKHHCKIQLEFKLRTGHLTHCSIQSCFQTLTQAEEIYKHYHCDSFVSFTLIKYWDLIMHWISRWDTVWNNHFRNLCRNPLSCAAVVFRLQNCNILKSGCLCFLEYCL